MDEPTEPIEHLDRHQHRRRTRLTLAAIGVLVLLIIALTPPLVNLDRLQRRIAASMTASLGRPVHLDDQVTFHIFPTPGFTLHNLVVSEDPAFGSEPTIRCGVVIAQLRLSSLWRRQVEFSKITFDTDEFGVGPSLNIVRAANGHYNIEPLLLQATRIDAAPTTQRSAGSTPRFPYIEAKSARINFKLGDEKMPFSLTDAEFALWLPEAQHWRFQLKGTPSRTDSNVPDPGVLRAEGSMTRAPSVDAMPIEISASWHDAPLGEASRLLTGNDAGWRGTLNFDASAKGTLGATQFLGRLTLNDLRRADFVPERPLDVSVACAAQGNLAAAQIATSHCDVPIADSTAWTIDANAIDLRAGTFGQVSAHGDDVPLDWIFAWFRVLSPHTPQDEDVPGRVNFSLNKTASSPWSAEGRVRFRTDPALDENADGQLTLLWKTPATEPDEERCPNAIELAPTAVAMGSAKSSPMTFSGRVSSCGYSYRAAGTATPESLLTLGAKLPTLAEGVADLLPQTPSPTHIDLTCNRAWGSPQECTTNTAQPVLHKPAGKHRG